MAVTMVSSTAVLPCGNILSEFSADASTAIVSTSKASLKQAVITGLKAEKNVIKVAYKRQSNCTGYQIQVTSNPKLTGGKVVTIADSNKNVGKVTAGYGIKYYVRVRAYSKNGKQVTHGVWSKVKTVTTPKKKYNLSAEEHTTMINKYTNIIYKLGEKYSMVNAVIFDMNGDNKSELIVNAGDYEAVRTIYYYSYNPSTHSVEKLKGTTSGSHRGFYKDKKTKKFVTLSNYFCVGQIDKISLSGKKVKYTQKSYITDTTARLNRWMKITKNFTPLESINIYDGELY